jgi:hypothetical protein
MPSPPKITIRIDHLPSTWAAPMRPHDGNAAEGLRRPGSLASGARSKAGIRQAMARITQLHGHIDAQPMAGTWLRNRRICP